MKRFVASLLIVFATLTVSVGPLVAQPALAYTDAGNGGGVPDSDSNCVKLSVPIIAGKNEVCGTDNSGGVIVAYLKLILFFASSAIGAVIVLMLIISGIQYLVSTGDPGQVKAAKNRIVNAVTALVLFAFMYAILNFLIPGGILG